MLRKFRSIQNNQSDESPLDYKIFALDNLAGEEFLQWWVCKLRKIYMSLSASTGWPISDHQLRFDSSFKSNFCNKNLFLLLKVNKTFIAQKKTKRNFFSETKTRFHLKINLDYSQTSSDNITLLNMIEKPELQLEICNRYDKNS